MNDIAAVKTLDTRPEKNRTAMREFFVESLRRIEAGELVAIMCIAEAKTGYEYTRIGFPFEKALGLHMRSIHDLQKDWDKSI